MYLLNGKAIERLKMGSISLKFNSGSKKRVTFSNRSLQNLISCLLGQVISFFEQILLDLLHRTKNFTNIWF